MREHPGKSFDWHLQALGFVLYNLYYVGFELNVLIGGYSVVLLVLLLAFHIVSWAAYTSKHLGDRQRVFVIVGLLHVACSLVFILTNQTPWFLFYASTIAITSVIYEEDRLLSIPMVTEAVCVIYALIRGGIFDFSTHYSRTENITLLLQVYGVNFVLFVVLRQRKILQHHMSKVVEESCRIPKEHLIPDRHRYQLYDFTRQLTQSCMGFKGRRHQRFIIDADPLLPRRLIGDMNRILRSVNNVISFEMSDQPEGIAVISISFLGESTNGGSLLISLVFHQRTLMDEEYKHLEEMFERIDRGDLTLQSQSGVELAMTAAMIHMMGGRLGLNLREDGVEYLFTVPQTYQDNRPMLEGYKNRTAVYVDQDRVRDGRLMRAYANSVDNLNKRLDTDVIFASSMAELREAFMRWEFKQVIVEIEDYMTNVDYFSKLEGRYEVILLRDHFDQAIIDGLNRHVFSRPVVLANILATVPELVQQKEQAWRSQAVKDAFYEAKAQLVTSTVEPNAAEQVRDIITEKLPEAARRQEEPKRKEKAPAAKTPSSLLNVEAGLVYCGGKEALYYGILKEYAQRGVANYKDAELSYAAQDWKNYTIHVHGIKSSTLSIGGESISARAKKLEMAGKENAINYILENHDKLIRDYKQLIADLQAFFDIAPPEPEEEAESVADLRQLSSEEVVAFMSELEEVAYSFDGDEVKKLLTKLDGASYKGKSLKAVQTDMLRKVEKEDYLSILSLAEEAFK